MQLNMVHARKSFQCTLVLNSVHALESYIYMYYLLAVILEIKLILKLISKMKQLKNTNRVKYTDSVNDFLSISLRNP